MPIFFGKVCSGRGLATDHLDDLMPRLAQQLGLQPVPGTLNVLLRRPVNLHLAYASIITPKRAFWPIKFNGIDALAYRWQRCPLHVVEIVSHLQLRKHFGLEDGAAVQLDLGAAVRSQSLISFMCWWLLWRGREPLYYSSNQYHRQLRKRLKRISRRASQDVTAAAVAE